MLCCIALHAYIGPMGQVRVQSPAPLKSRGLKHDFNNFNLLQGERLDVYSKTMLVITASRYANAEQW